MGEEDLEQFDEQVRSCSIISYFDTSAEMCSVDEKLNIIIVSLLL